MSLKEFHTFSELEEALNNDPNLVLQIDDDECNVIDVVELPPNNMDIMSDEEGIDEDLLGESVPTGVPSLFSIHSSIQENISKEKLQSEPRPKMQKRCSKMQRTKSHWKKDKKDFSKICGDNQAITERHEKLKCYKSVVEIFETLLTEDIMKFIVKENVVYGNQNNHYSFHFSVDGLKKFWSFLLLTGYHSLPQEKMY